VPALGWTSGGKGTVPENELPAVLTISADFEAMRRRRSDISDKRSGHHTFVAVSPGERMIELARGCGRLMRRILQVLETTPGRKLDRLALERVLVAEGFDASNVLRSLRALSQRHLVAFEDRRHKRESLVALPRKFQRIAEVEILALLAEIKDKGGRK
jgi:hypothetical protein